MMLSHIMKVHKNDPDFFAKCEVTGCHESFRNANSYKSHCYRYRKSELLFDNLSVLTPQPQPFCNEEQEPMNVEDFAPEGNGIVHENEMYDTLEDRIEASKKQNALYLLQTKEANLLTQKALDGIVDSSTTLVRNTVDLIRCGVQNRLDSAGISFDAVPGLDDLFKEEHIISNPFLHVDSRYKQKAYFVENFELVVRE